MKFLSLIALIDGYIQQGNAPSVFGACNFYLLYLIFCVIFIVCFHVL